MSTTKVKNIPSIPKIPRVDAQKGTSKGKGKAVKSGSLTVAEGRGGEALSPMLGLFEHAVKERNLYFPHAVPKRSEAASPVNSLDYNGAGFHDRLREACGSNDSNELIDEYFDVFLAAFMPEEYFNGEDASHAGSNVLNCPEVEFWRIGDINDGETRGTDASMNEDDDVAEKRLLKQRMELFQKNFRRFSTKWPTFVSIYNHHRARE